MFELIACLPVLIGLIFLVCVLLVEPRSLWSGISLLTFVGLSGISMVFLLLRYSAELSTNAPWLVTLLILIAASVIVFLMLFPLLLSGIFFVEGVRLIRREGLSAANYLSIGFSIFILLVIFVFPVLLKAANNSILDFFYGMAAVVVGYLSFLLAIYVLSSWINLIHFRNKNRFDQIVVLGSGLFGTTVPPLLAARIDAGIALQQKNPGALLILSGGQGPGEDIPEGAAMKVYALEHGADPLHTVSEERSRNTLENLTLSRLLFQEEEKRGNTAIVTTRYHVFRALLLGKSIGLPCLGYGSKTKWYFTLNAMLREFIAYLYETRKRQMKIIFCLLLPFLFVGLMTLIFGWFSP